MLEAFASTELERPPEPALPRAAAIASLAGVPASGRLPNSTVAERAGVSEEWIVKRVGVHERTIAPPDQALHELAAQAGAQALEAAGLAATELDLIIVATCTHDHVMPSAAALVSNALGAPQAGTFDVNAVCNGFISSLALAASTVEAGRAERVLVIGADVLSRWVDPSDRRTAPVFGDGAGAAVVAPARGRGRIGPHILRTDGDAWHLVRCRLDGTMVMEGRETYKHAVNRMTEVTGEVLERAGLTLDDVDAFVYHQANVRILRAIGERLAIEPERIVNAMTHTGNTTAGSIPLALCAADRAGMLQPGARILAGGFGSGFAYGAMVMEWDG